MANTITNVKDAGNIICKLAAGRFQEKPLFCTSIMEQDSSVLEGKNGYKAGDTVKINVPPIYTAHTTFDITSNIQDSVETTKDLDIDIISNVAMKVNTLELATEIY